MTQKSPRNRRVIGDDQRAAASELLRNLDRPLRLRGNPLAQRHLAGTPNVADDPGLATVRRIVGDAVEHLPAMQRSIIERCDMSGELHKAVAADLAITERHFYRVRHRALAEIALALQRREPRVERTVDRPSEGRVAIALATALDQVGQRRAAIEVLAAASARCATLDERIRLEDVHAQYLAESGAWEAALDRLCALEPATGPASSEERNVFAARINVSKASVLATARDLGAVTPLLPRALVTLRAASRSSASLGTIEAFASALLLQAEHRQDIGQVDDAIMSAREAVTVLESRADASSLLALQAQTAAEVMVARVRDDHESSTAIRRLGDLSRVALRFGLVQRSLMIAAELGVIHRIRGEPHLALATVLPLLPTIRTVCSGRDLGITLLDLAAAHAMTGNAKASNALVIETTQARDLDPYTAAMAHIRLGELQVRLGQPLEALEHAREARAEFVRMANPRLVGAALRVEAEAFLARGDRRAAGASIAAALDLLRGASYPYALARAVALSARIGNAS